MAAREAHQVAVAFADEPMRQRIISVGPACLVALKQAAFGRSRGPDAEPVERDFHDAYLIIDAAADDLVQSWDAAEYEVRERASDAADRLAAGGEETAAAARQLVLLGDAPNQRAAEAAVRRAAARMQRRLAART